MKALLSKTVGGPETLVLEDVPSPTAAAGLRRGRGQGDAGSTIPTC